MLFIWDISLFYFIWLLDVLFTFFFKKMCRIHMLAWPLKNVSHTHAGMATYVHSSLHPYYEIDEPIFCNANHKCLFIPVCI